MNGMSSVQLVGIARTVHWDAKDSNAFARRPRPDAQGCPFRNPIRARTPEDAFPPVEMETYLGALLLEECEDLLDPVRVTKEDTVVQVPTAPEELGLLGDPLGQRL
jgi:hypothetical protein